VGKVECRVVLGYFAVFQKILVLIIANTNVFLPADTYTHTFCTIQVDKNMQNRTIHNGIGG